MRIQFHDLQTGQRVRQVIAARMQVVLRRSDRLVAEKLLSQLASRRRRAGAVLGSRVTYIEEKLREVSLVLPATWEQD